MLIYTWIAKPVILPLHMLGNTKMKNHKWPYIQLPSDWLGLTVFLNHALTQEYMKCETQGRMYGYELALDTWQNAPSEDP